MLNGKLSSTEQRWTRLWRLLDRTRFQNSQLDVPKSHEAPNVRGQIEVEGDGQEAAEGISEDSEPAPAEPIQQRELRRRNAATHEEGYYRALRVEVIGRM
jgi:hypothetical protein